MKAAQFEYHAPATVAEAVALLAEHADSGIRILAGGQSLVPTMAYRLARPAHLVDINRIAGLDGLIDHTHELEIGALVRHQDFAASDASLRLNVILAHIANRIAHRPIRARGTFCGSLAHADPASEWCLVAATLDTDLFAESVRGVRTISSASFFQGIMATALAEDEFLTKACIKRPDADTRFGFFEFSRRVGDFALAACFVSFRLVSGIMQDVRLGIGGVEDFPRRLSEVEHFLEAQAPNSGLFISAGQLASKRVRPSAVDADYRTDLVKTVVERALQHAHGSDQANAVHS